MTLAAVLLAGGESRRMGRDKATLSLEGVPLWRKQLDVLRQLSPAELLVSARGRPVWLPADVCFIADPVPPRGPLGGLAAVLKSIKSSHLLALPVDLPAMTASHLASLWRAAKPGCGVLPWMEERAEPLPAIYPAEAAAVAVQILESPRGDLSLRAFVEALSTAGCMEKEIIRSQDSYLYGNCNTPADWQRHVTNAKSDD